MAAEGWKGGGGGHRRDRGGGAAALGPGSERKRKGGRGSGLRTGLGGERCLIWGKTVHRKLGGGIFAVKTVRREGKSENAVWRSPRTSFSQ